jgi:hypothetical protein
MCSSSPIEVSAGAVMEEQSGERNAKVEMMRDV